MYVVPTPKPLGPPRGRDGRYRIDMERLLELQAQGYSPRQIGTILGVSGTTVRLRLRERTNEPLDPHFAELGRKGQKARKRAMRRRKREAEAEAEAETESQQAAEIDGLIMQAGLAALIGDRRREPGDYQA